MHKFLLETLMPLRISKLHRNIEITLSKNASENLHFSHLYVSHPHSPTAFPFVALEQSSVFCNLHHFPGEGLFHVFIQSS